MKSSIYSALLLTSFVFVAGCAGQPKASNPEVSFLTTLNIHLSAIQNADLAALDPTVADSVLLISPQGHLLRSKKSFMSLHEKWFERKSWTWTGTVVKTNITDSLGSALLRYTYTEKDSTGAVAFSNHNYLMLIFRNSEAGWQLVHDQNTAIPANSPTTGN